MSRVTVHRILPPLTEVLKHFTEFPKGKSRKLVMISELRQASKKLRSAQPQPFYAMREVADFFRAPISTISTVYRTLEGEGLISRIRGSCTMLNGKMAVAREHVRGVIGIPISMRHIVVLPYTQTLLLELEERLGRMGYVADIVFNLAEHAPGLLRRNLDAVIFHATWPHLKQDILSLRERGVRVLCIQRKDSLYASPGLIYLKDYHPAYQSMAARWRQIGIRQVLLHASPKILDSPAEIGNMKSILNQHGLKAEAVMDEPKELLKRMRQQGPKFSTALAFLASVEAELMCNCEPDVIADIAKIGRLAFCVGRLRLPGLEYRKVRADIINVSPTEIATKLANDIGRLSILPDGITHTFFATYEEQARL